MDFLLDSPKKNKFCVSVAENDLKCAPFSFPLFLLQLEAFGGIIIILPYPLQDLSNLPTLIGHFFPQPTLKGNSSFFLCHVLFSFIFYILL